MKRRTALACLLAAALAAGAQEAVSFPSKDGLELSADLYMPHPASAPLVVLYHMAGSSRGEYRSIAPRLNRLGFNAVAVDLRSGGSSGGVVNESARRARAAGKPSSYIDALPDMQAALAYARARLAKGRVILWGSSYSAALVLKMAGDEPASCDAALAFSPGEYFYPRDLVASSARRIRVPVFISSSRSEEGDWRPLFDLIPSSKKVSFLPTASGAHGSPALHPGTSGEAEYWAAVTAFLASLR